MVGVTGTPHSSTAIPPQLFWSSRVINFVCVSHLISSSHLHLYFSPQHQISLKREPTTGTQYFANSCGKSSTLLVPVNVVPRLWSKTKNSFFLVSTKSWWEFRSIMKEGGEPGGRKGIIKDKKWNIKIEGNPLLSWNSVSHPVSFPRFLLFSQGHRVKIVTEIIVTDKSKSYALLFLLFLGFFNRKRERDEE